MSKSKHLKNKFDSIEKCYIPLLSYQVNTCVKCGCDKFYITIENFEKTCKKCKKRQCTKNCKSREKKLLKKL